ncbi:hypothetical protein ABIC80_003595 [Kosakonia sp. 1610]
MKALLWARFCRPDKRKRHPAIRAAMIMPDGSSALSGLREQQQKSPSRCREGLCTLPERGALKRVLGHALNQLHLFAVQ